MIELPGDTRHRPIFVSAALFLLAAVLMMLLPIEVRYLAFVDGIEN